MMFDEENYFSPSSEMYTYINTSPNSNSNSKKLKMMNKKRFSDEQVRSLESIFENETKLEPKKKVQLAKDLGLQPRQIAIWFQNKRARYKSKQLERDYNILRANYNALASKFDNLKKEKQSLLVQLEKLKGIVEKSDGEKQKGNESGVTNSEESRSEIDKFEKSKNEIKSVQSEELKPTISLDGSEYGGASMLSSDEGSSENNNYFGMEEDTDLLTMVQPIVGHSLTSPQEWDGLYDHSLDNSQWLDFWS
ncbi:hypothetical protein RND81_03G224500 [Saponaria officinalis]|uniref:Homeobox-leucine zipper protein n=1 Tax=Saponaria officinalis TaxID=3572 RepID=A0AAW1M9Y7_SAPOF